MSGYCPDCGNTQCLCKEVAADEAGRKAHSLDRVVRRQQRSKDMVKINVAYSEVEDALRHAGKLLRTTHAGEYMWASDHKTAITGLRIVMEQLRRNLPHYDA